MELAPDERKFVEATLAPLPADEGMEALLEEATGVASMQPKPASGNSADSAAMAAARMARTTKRFHRVGLFRRILPYLTILVCAWLTFLSPAAIRSIRAIVLGNRVAASEQTMGGIPSPVGDLFGSSLDFREKLESETRLRLPAEPANLLTGVPSSYSVDRWKKVWEAHPDRPEHFWAYAMEYYVDRGSWPADLVSTGERLDPGNGWFRLVVAGSLLKSVLSDPPPSKWKGAPLYRRRFTPPVFRIRKIVTDPLAFGIARTELERALAMPRFDDYRERLNPLRYACLFPATEFSDEGMRRALSRGQPEDSSDDWVAIGSVSELLTRPILQAGEEGDRETLHKLEAQLEELARRIASLPAMTYSGFLCHGLVHRGAKAFSQAWAAVGEKERSGQFAEVADRMDGKRHPFVKEVEDALSESRGGIFAQSYEGDYRSPDGPRVSEAELRGGRLAEYAMYERLLLYGVAALLVLVGALLLTADLIDRKPLGTLPLRLTDLLTATDWLITLALGVLLPLLLYAVATRWLEPRRFGLTDERFLRWGIQTCALVLQILLAVFHTVRWRLGRRGAVLALGWTSSRMGRLVLVFAFAAPLFEVLVGHFGIPGSLPEQVENWILWTPLTLPVWGVLKLGIGIFITPAGTVLQRAAIVSAMVPPIALAQLLVTGALAAVHAEERFWVRRIDFEALSPERWGHDSKIDEERNRWLCEQTLEALKQWPHAE